MGGHWLMGQRFANLEFGPSGRLHAGRSVEGSPTNDARAALAVSTSPTELVGPYIGTVPGAGKCRIMIKSIEGGLVAVSDRQDWPPSRLDVRADLVFLRGIPGLW